ncbi:SCO family protein [Blastopirellula sp. JC732]|uniref:SCO family protein n=1 Tax=Blastopirellula sediminis TaxID=2894196 RepID=A0A9X1MTL5_9BACT|nr:SCO family protein [Blastopirellula sediminis]MCC9605346.1 SCO family protein [Blastopirellula sediminis]MCC9631354.1 SCO family protein [Blastopirellula sediminis]
MNKTFAFFLATLFVLIGGMIVWFAANAKNQESGMRDVDSPKHNVTVPENVYIGEFALTDSAGAEFDSKELDGDVWVGSFFFTTCPSICRLLNQQVAVLAKEFKGQDVKFVSITCDPATDTPEVLAKYAQMFEADPSQWKFLTGDLEKIQEISEKQFHVGFAKQTHSERMVVIDRNGKLRGSFLATQNSDFKAARKLIKELLEEKPEEKKSTEEPPAEPMESFTLTERSGQEFDSKSLDGKYWLGSFFFTTCPSTCTLLNLENSRLQAEYADRGLKIVSITCDPANDTPNVLTGYAERFIAKPDVWYFLTGDLKYIEKIGANYFHAVVKPQTHSEQLYLVGPDGKVIDSYAALNPTQMRQLRKKLDEVLGPKQEETSEQPSAESAGDEGSSAGETAAKQE